MKVLWTQKAIDRIDEILDHLAADSTARAAKFCEELVDATQQLDAQPLSGPLLPEDAAYRQLVVNNCRIVYGVMDNAVYIMTIVGPGMLYEHAI